MLKKIIFITLIIPFFLLTGCDFDKEKLIIERKSLCKNELELFQPKNNIKLLNFRLNSKNDNIIQLLNDELNLLGIETEYGITIDDIVIKTYVVNAKDFTYLHHMSAIEIVFNDKGKALIDGFSNVHYEIIEIDSISNFFDKHYPTKGFGYLNKIRLDWDENISEKSLNNGIKEIMKGHLKAVRRIALNKFNKKLCELNETEFDEIMKILPFEFELRPFSNEFTIIDE